MSKKKVLIFYISKYSGHYQAARAIEGAFRELEGDFEIELVNAFDYTNPILGKVITKTYIEVIKNRPDVWGSVYDNPEVLKKVVKAREVLHKLNGPKMRRLLERSRPDIVYCTQAFPCGMVADYKGSYGKDIHLVAVLTDHAPHSYWLFDEVDHYVVPSEKTASMLEKKGCPREKIFDYGIPVDTRFSRECAKDVLKRDYGVEDGRPTVLLMGGSQGLGAIESIVGMFLADDMRYQLMVVAGRNKRLHGRLVRMTSRRPDIKVFPYVNRIEELMEISDVIITKAGGITTSEALAKKLPILVVNPIPGQERLNTEFLVEQGAAVEIKDTARIKDALDDIFGTENKLGRMKDAAARIAKPDSALKIAELALKEH